MTQVLNEELFDLAATTPGIPLSFEEMLRTERAKWRIKVVAMATGMKKIEHLSVIQVDLYTNRQILLEALHTRLAEISGISKIVKELSKEVKDRYAEETKNINASELKRRQDEFLWKELHDIELLKNHSDYLRESMQTVDNMIYGIRHRINLEDYKRN